MKRMMIATGFCLSVGICGAGCATSHQEQQRALSHQENSDNAAKNGQYGIAESEQRKAEASHHKAAVKAIDEGRPIPAQTQSGDKPSSDN